MLELRREPGRPLRIGHRGAPALAPENTIASLERAVAHGVDVVEIDVLDTHDGELVLAHADDLHAVSHGLAAGRVRPLTLERLRAVAPALPTFSPCRRRSGRVMFALYGSKISSAGSPRLTW